MQRTCWARVARNGELEARLRTGILKRFVFLVVFKCSLLVAIPYIKSPLSKHTQRPKTPSSSSPPMSNTFWSQNHINFAALEDEYNFNANQPQQQNLFPYPPQHDRYGYQQQPTSSSLQEAFGLNQSQQQPIQHSSSFGASQSHLPGYFSPHQAPSTVSTSSSYHPLPTSPTYGTELPRHDQLVQRYGTPSALPTLDTNLTSPSTNSSVQPTRLHKRARDEHQPDDQSGEQAPPDHKDAKAKLYVNYPSSLILLC